MLQKVQEYKWHILIGISILIMMILMYQSYSTNKKVNMLFRCINELSCRIEDVADATSAPVIVQRPQQPQLKQGKSKPQEGKRSVQQQARPKTTMTPMSPQVKVAQKQFKSEVEPSQQPIVSETIIFQVAPSPQVQTKPVVASTIEEIDSDSDVEVEETKMKDVDLDKALEAELSELNE
jgi:hypothetical protein